jgi:integrative and conjugative element protein (TIGR02256 family)
MGRLRWAPHSIQQLHISLEERGIDLLGSLRANMRRAHEVDQTQLNSRPLIIVKLPFLNVDGTPTGEADIKAFTTETSVDLAKLGVDLGVFYSSPQAGSKVFLRIQPDLKPPTDDVPILVMAVQPTFSRSVATMASGLPFDQRKVVLIGAGSLGSHLIDIMRRDGFGVWTAIDKDAFLPHNIQRHRGSALLIGAPKAKVAATTTDWAVGAPDETGAIASDIFDSHPDSNQALADAALIIEATASIPVARRLSDMQDIVAPRFSTFLNGTGQGAVFLAEDDKRTMKLDSLEAQYYRAVLDVPALSTHLSEIGRSYMYPGGCGSISFKIAEHQVSLLSGALAGEIRRRLESGKATITVWTYRETTGLRRVSLRTHRVDRIPLMEWEAVIDHGVIDSAADFRQRALPNETGGILLGTIDISRRQICVVKLVPAPSDSVGDPMGFKRGTKNLAVIISDASKRSLGQVEYVGEWHAHPQGASLNASDTDLRQLIWLCEERAAEELPALMMIVGDQKKYVLNMAAGIAP